MNLLINKYRVITGLLKSEFTLLHSRGIINLMKSCENDIVLPLVKHNTSLNGVMNLLINKYRVITSLLKSEFPLLY